VEFKPSLEEVVLFELPTDRYAYQLLTHLKPGRLAWLQDGDAVSIVGAVLTPDVADFAELFRNVQAWLHEERLVAIRFEVDGRTYVLEARQPALTPG
jgi:hypothetical protein